MKWSELIEQLEMDDITPGEENKRIRGYDMIKSVIDTLEKTEPPEDWAPFIFKQKKLLQFRKSFFIFNY
ncbi:hypothetical protein [Metabacillus halosaccharovorans]|uniref:hypothetical protein n=1 Tax=Metabacillus halosaccharovorans TaxID=930124 RepID=UPI001C1F718D|nr:hypothetical protein [Metabacillus halosaccharovorans]MBU7592206.1 hypothetical protein [Metabacillus halosaccharovorans]